MTRLLGKLFNLQPREWPRLLLLCLMLFLTNAGMIWGIMIVEAAFLQQAGVERLPLIQIASAISGIVLTSLYTAFADRASNDRLLLAILLIAAAAMGLCRGLTALGWRGAFIALYPIALVYIDTFNMHWATYVIGFYDTQSAKRIFPVVGAAARVAAVVAGLSMPLLNRLLAPDNIIVVWIGLLLAVALLTWLLPLLLRERRTSPATRGRATEPVAPLDHMREGYHYVVQSSFLRWMAAATMLLLVLIACINYQMGQIFLRDLKTTQQISNFVGLVNAATNMLMLPFLLFGISRITRRVGVSNAYLIYPAGTLAIVGGLVTLPGLATAGLAYFDRAAFRLTFHFTLDSLLYNAVPLRVKARARGFINGLLVPLGTLVGGLLLLALPLVPFSSTLPVLLVLLASGFMGSALLASRQYARALLELLEQEDYARLLVQDGSALVVADPVTVQALGRKIDASTSPEMTIFLANLLGQVGGAMASPMLERLARGTNDTRVRAAVLAILADSGGRSESLQQLYVELSADGDLAVRQAALAGLELLVGANDPLFLRIALERLADADPDYAVRTRVLPPLLRATSSTCVTAGRAALEHLLSAADPHARAAGTRVLGQLELDEVQARLAHYLDDPADEVRLEAALQLEARISDRPAQASAVTSAQMTRLMHDPVQRVRQAALTMLGYATNANAHALLVDALADPDAHVRTTAADALVRAGRTALPTVRAASASPDHMRQITATAVLGRIDRRAFGAQAESLIDGNLHTIYGNTALLTAFAPLNNQRGSAVMRASLREQNIQLRDEIYFLLDAFHTPDALHLIAAALGSSDPRVRANAAEALESLAGPRITRRLAPLFDPQATTDGLLEIGRAEWGMQLPDLAGALHQLATSSSTWQRTMVANVLAAHAATHAPAPAAAVADGQRGRRGRGIDALRALDDLDATLASRAAAASAPADPLLIVIDTLLRSLRADPEPAVRQAASPPDHAHDGGLNSGALPKEELVLSTIERIIFLKEVPFFQGMTIDQLKVLAAVCEEQLFARDAAIFKQGDPGGVLYVVVSGRVGIEREKRRGAIARIATVEAHGSFGESSLFDNSPRTTAALALQDTLTLQLRREPLIALARQNPDLSLALITVLSQHLRAADERAADLTKARPRELHKLFDQFEEE